jgi:hypothetical protein
MEEPIELSGILESNVYGRVGVKVKIVDSNAVAVFSNPRLGRDLVAAEKKAGNKNISFQERTGWMIETFPGMDKKTIVTKLMKEMNLKPKDGSSTA